MREIQPDWSEILRITWLVIWRVMLGAGITGFVVGFILAALGAPLGGAANAPLRFATAGVVVLFWWPYVVHMALKKRYKGFRLALIATDA